MAKNFFDTLVLGDTTVSFGSRRLLNLEKFWRKSLAIISYLVILEPFYVFSTTEERLRQRGQQALPGLWKEVGTSTSY